MIDNRNPNLNHLVSAQFKIHENLSNRAEVQLQKHQVLELRKNLAKPEYFAPKLELVENDINNSSEVIINAKTFDDEVLQIDSKLDTNKTLSGELLEKTKDLNSLKQNTGNDYAKEASTFLNKNPSLKNKIYEQEDAEKKNPDTGKLISKSKYVESKIENYCKETLKTVRGVITRHAHEPETINENLIRSEVQSEIIILREAYIQSILDFIPELGGRDILALEESLDKLPGFIIEDIMVLNENIARGIDIKTPEIEQRFELELESNLLRLGYQPNLENSVKSSVDSSLRDSIIFHSDFELESELERSREPKPAKEKKNNTYRLKDIVSDKIRRITENKKISWETCRNELLKIEIDVTDILEADETNKKVTLRDLGYDFTLMGSIEKNPKEFNIVMTTPSIENNHEFSIRNIQPEAFLSFQITLPQNCNGLSFVPHKRKLEDDQSTEASDNISEKGLDEDLIENETGIPKAREIRIKSLLTRLANAFKLSLGIDPDSKTGILRNIARIFTTTPISVYVVSALVAGAVIFLTGGVGLPIAIFFSMILFSWTSRLFTTTSDAFTKNLTDLSLQAPGTKYRKRKIAGAVIGWIIATAIALGLNILKGVITFGNNDFSILRTDGEERLSREIILIRTLEAISVLGSLTIFAGLGYVGFVALSLSGSSGLGLIMQLSQLSNSSFPLVYTIGMAMLSSPLALTTISTLTIIAASLAGFKSLVFLIKDVFLPLIQLIKNNIELTNSEAKNLLGRKERFTDSTNTMPPLRGMIGSDILYPVLQMLQVIPEFSTFPEDKKQVLILQHMVGSDYMLNQYRACLELYKLIAKYRLQGATTLKEIINKISRGFFNRLEDKNMIIMLRRLCENDAIDLDSPDFLNEVENNLSRSIKILIPFISVPNYSSDVDRILKDSVEYKNKIYNSSSIDDIFEIGQFPREERKYISAVLAQSKVLTADLGKMSTRQIRINAEKMVTKSLKPDWLLKRQYGLDEWQEHRYYLNGQDKLLCRSIEVEKVLSTPNAGVPKKTVENNIAQKIGYYLGNSEPRKRLADAMYPKKNILLSIARFFGFKSELAKPTDTKSSDGIRADYAKRKVEGKFITAISGETAELISFDPEEFPEIPCPIYRSKENVEYLTAEYKAKSKEFKKINRALKKQEAKILRLTIELKRNIEPYIQNQDPKLLNRYKKIKEQIAEELQKEAYIIRLLNLCEQIMNFDRVRLQQLADLNKNDGRVIYEKVHEEDQPNNTNEINSIRKEYNLISEDPRLANIPEKFINPVFTTSSNLQKVTAHLENLRMAVNSICNEILADSKDIYDLLQNEVAIVKPKLAVLKSSLKEKENKLILYLADARAITQGVLNQLNESSSRNPINLDTARTLLAKYRSIVPNPRLLSQVTLDRDFGGWTDAYDNLLCLSNTDYKKNIDEANEANNQLINSQAILLSGLREKTTSLQNKEAVLSSLRHSRENPHLIPLIEKDIQALRNEIKEIKLKADNTSEVIKNNRSRSLDHFIGTIETNKSTLSSLAAIAEAKQGPESLREEAKNLASTARQQILEHGESFANHLRDELENENHACYTRLQHATSIDQDSNLGFQKLLFEKAQILNKIAKLQGKKSLTGKGDPELGTILSSEYRLLENQYTEQLYQYNQILQRHHARPQEEVENSEEQVIANLLKELEKKQTLILDKIRTRAGFSNNELTGITGLENEIFYLYKDGLTEQINLYYDQLKPSCPSEKTCLLDFVSKISSMNNEEKNDCFRNIAAGMTNDEIYKKIEIIDSNISRITKQVSTIIKKTIIGNIETIDKKLAQNHDNPKEIAKILQDDCSNVMSAIEKLENTLLEDLKHQDSASPARHSEPMEAVSPILKLAANQLDQVYSNFTVPILHIEAELSDDHQIDSDNDITESLSEADNLYNRVSKNSLRRSEERISLQEEIPLREASENIAQSDLSDSSIRLNLAAKNASEVQMNKRSVIDYSELDHNPEEAGNFLQKGWRKFIALFSKASPKIQSKKLTNQADIRAAFNLYKDLTLALRES